MTDGNNILHAYYNNYKAVQNKNGTVEANSYCRVNCMFTLISGKSFILIIYMHQMNSYIDIS